MSQQVGYLTWHPFDKDGWFVVGSCCASKVKHTSAIYHVNIYPYRQSCCACGKVLVEGAKGWCELHTGNSVAQPEQAAKSPATPSNHDAKATCNEVPNG